MKNATFFYDCLIDFLPILLDFGLQLGGQERTRELTFRALVEVLLALGAKMAPRPAEVSIPIYPMYVFQLQFGVPLGGSSVTFWVVLGGVLGVFWGCLGGSWGGL